MRFHPLDDFQNCRVLFRCHFFAYVVRNGKGVAVLIGAGVFEHHRQLNCAPVEQLALLFKINHRGHFPHAIDHERRIARGEQRHCSGVFGIAGGLTRSHPIGNHLHRFGQFFLVVTRQPIAIRPQRAILLAQIRIDQPEGKTAIRRRHRHAPFGAAFLQFGQGGAEIINAVQTRGQAVVSNQSSSRQLVLVVIKHDRMRVEGYRVLFAIDMHRVPGGACKSVRRQAHCCHVIRRNFRQRALTDCQRNAAGVIGHDIRTLAHGGRGLHLGIKRDAPIQRRRLNFDAVSVFGVEVFQQFLHSHAVAAAKEIPPYHGFLCLDPKRQCRQQRGR